MEHNERNGDCFCSGSGQLRIHGYGNVRCGPRFIVRPMISIRCHVLVMFLLQPLENKLLEHLLVADASFRGERLDALECFILKEY